MKPVERPLYMTRMKPFVSNGNVKIITGIRRSGKSTFLKEFVQIVAGKPVLRLDMEYWGNRRYRDPDAAYEYIRKSVDEGAKVVIIDEIQEIKDWKEIIRSLVGEGDCDLYISGSNSKLLSGEFASMLTGRYNLFYSFTLTYSECLIFNKAYGGEKDVFSRFLRVGGFPSVWKNNYDESDALSEVGDILHSIMMRDIVERYEIRRPDLLHRIFRFICDNIGNRTSVNNIYTTLASEEKNLSRDLVYEYVDHLESACLIYKAETYDVKGKKILKSPYKYYLADIGLKNAMCGYRPEDIQGYVENIVYLEMKARGYRAVWLGDRSGKEIDFICKKGNDTVYIQATTRLTSENVKREYGSLLGIRDNYPKYVVVFEKSPLDADMDGIKCILLEEFLRNGD